MKTINKTIQVYVCETCGEEFQRYFKHDRQCFYKIISSTRERGTYEIDEYCKDCGSENGLFYFNIKELPESILEQIYNWAKENHKEEDL